VVLIKNEICNAQAHECREAKIISIILMWQKTRMFIVGMILAHVRMRLLI